MKNIDNCDIRMHIIESIVETFDAMLSAALEPTDTILPEYLENLRNAVAVSFIGDATGLVSIHMDDHFTRQLAAETRGMEVGELEGDEDINEMMRSLGDIVGDNLKLALTDAGLACTLSTPSFTTGNDFKVESLNMEGHERFTFRSGAHLVFVEMAVKISKPVQIDGHQAKDIEYKADQDEAKETLSEADVAAIWQKVNEEPEAAAVEPAVEDQHQPETDSRPTAAEPRDTASQPQPKQPQRSEDFDLDLLLDIPLELKVELGRARIQIQELLNLKPGSAVKLVRLDGEPVDILANDTLIAKGEVVVQNEKYGIRITEITSRMDRIRSFSI